MTRARGEGSLFRARYRDRQGRPRTASTWTLQFYDRRLHRPVQIAGFKSKEAAELALRQALADRDAFEKHWHLQSLIRQARRAPIEFTGDQMAVLRGPLVYAWFCGDAPLYVGMSANGLLRVLDRKHHALRVESGDRIRVWPCASVEEAVALERRLIDELQPLQNTQRSWGRTPA